MADFKYLHSAIVCGIPVDGTYELVGPMVQGNAYDFSKDIKVEILVGEKMKQVPKHYLVRHGSIRSDFNMEEFISIYKRNTRFISSYKISGNEIGYHFIADD